MDFSQLPKMSKTPTPPPAGDPAPETSDTEPAVEAAVATPAATAPQTPRRERVAVDYASLPYEVGYGSVWLSLIAGLIFLLFGQNFARWLLAKMSGHEFVTGWLQADGVTPVKYFELQGGTAWTDAGLFLMGIALLLDAAILGIMASRGRPNRGLLLATVVLTSIAMLINAGVVAYLISIGITLPLTSLIALAVGGFVVFDHAPMLKSPSSAP